MDSKISKKPEAASPLPTELNRAESKGTSSPNKYDSRQESVANAVSDLRERVDSKVVESKRVVNKQVANIDQRELGDSKYSTGNQGISPQREKTPIDSRMSPFPSEKPRPPQQLDRSVAPATVPQYNNDLAAGQSFSEFPPQEEVKKFRGGEQYNPYPPVVQERTDYQPRPMTTTPDKQKRSGEGPFIIGPGASIDTLLDRFTREELKVLFKEAYSVLTTLCPKDLLTRHETMQALLGRVLGEIPIRGGTYGGEIVNGLPNGRGTAKYSTGDIYEGDWWNGKKDGMGCMRFLDPDSQNYQDVYTGQFSRGRFDGLGTYKHAFGATFYGSFREDRRHGPYHYAFKDGREMFGIYEEDNEDGPFVWISADRNIIKAGNKHQGFKNGEIKSYILDKVERWEHGVLVKSVQVAVEG